MDMSVDVAVAISNGFNGAPLVKEKVSGPVDVCVRFQRTWTRLHAGLTSAPKGPKTAALMRFGIVLEHSSLEV
jgi:hypothetical protein